MTLWQSLCKYVCYDDDDDMIIITSAHEVYESAGTETFRIPLMFAGLQRYVYIPVSYTHLTLPTTPYV